MILFFQELFNFRSLSVRNQTLARVFVIIFCPGPLKEKNLLLFDIFVFNWIPKTYKNAVGTRFVFPSKELFVHYIEFKCFPLYQI